MPGPIVYDFGECIPFTANGMPIDYAQFNYLSKCYLYTYVLRSGRFTLSLADRRPELQGQCMPEPGYLGPGRRTARRKLPERR
jgi:hypothetical protein